MAAKILDVLEMQKTVKNHWVDPTLGYCLKLPFGNQTTSLMTIVLQPIVNNHMIYIP